MQAFKVGIDAKPPPALPAVGAAIPTLLLVFSSVSQLTLRDGLLSVFFGFGLLWYIRRANFINR